jgi:lysophospholipase L1-like esterase
VVVDEVVCPNDTCAWWDDGEWLYRDTAHLSPEGVRRLAPLLREFIQKRIENQ